MSSEEESIVPADNNLRGWLPDVPDHRDVPFRIAVPQATPSSADVSSLLNPAPNQINLGSCVANASTSAYEWLFKKEENGASTDFSRLFIYFYARKLGGFPTNQDTGCYIRDAMKALAKFGTCLETTWPYDLPKFKVEPSKVAIEQALNYQALFYYRCTNLNDIKASIGVDGFPVVGGFSVPASIYSASTTKTGIVSYPGPKDKIIGGHAVIFCGFSDKTRLLTFQNSWGTAWGSKGFGFLPYEFIERGLADDFWTIRSIEIPAVSASSSSTPAASSSSSRRRLPRRPIVRRR